MKILSTTQIKDWDLFTIEKEPITSVDLMERAAFSTFKWVRVKFSKTRPFYVFCGPGNNGGDGLALARLLLKARFNVKVFIVNAGQYSQDFLINKERLEQIHTPLFIENTIPIFPSDAVLIDALFGSGLNRPLRGIYASLVKQINDTAAIKVAIDMPSGLFSDIPTPGTVIVKADFTLTFQVPKIALLLPESGLYAGEMVVLPIDLHPVYLEEISCDRFMLTSKEIAPLLIKRNKFSHKGTFGRALILAGSFGMIGAALLAAKACGRAGAGLVTAYLPACGYAVFQSSYPEALALTDPEEYFITKIPDVSKYDAIGTGPGLYEGIETAEMLQALFSAYKKPIVIDASALNVISKHRNLLKEIPEGSILTPHPKEFERLAGKPEHDFDCLERLKAFAAEIKAFVVLKGAHSVIASPDGKLFFNSTGNPGMATGGSGDVLTGILTALLAQGYQPLNAALLGVYLHGFAGDVAASKMGYASLIASDIIESIKDFYTVYSD